MKKAAKQSTLVKLCSFGSMLLVAAAILATGAVYLANDNIIKKESDRFNLTENANRFMNGSAYLTNEVRAYSVTGNAVHKNNYWNEINNLKNRDIGVSTMKQIGITESEQQMINEMMSISNELVPLEEKAMQNVEAGHMSEAVAYVHGAEYEAAIGKISALKLSFLEALDVRTQNEIDVLMSRASMLQGFTFFLIAMVIVLQILTYSIMKGRVLRPIAAIEREIGEIARGNLSSDFLLEPDTSELGQLIAAIQKTRATLHQYINDISDKLVQMAAGDMSVQMDLEYIGDFAPIRTSLQTIAYSLKDTLNQIETAAQQVSIGAEQVSSGAQILATGSAEQAAIIEELNASAMELSTTAEDNLLQVKTTTEQLGRTSENLFHSNQRMTALTEAMAEISNTSNHIANITKVIEDIVFQTNILALNAAGGDFTMICYFQYRRR